MTRPTAPTRRLVTRPITRLAVAAGLLTAAACSAEMTMAHPACNGEGGSWLIVAQSVPTASQVPCLDPLPHGWDIETVAIDESGTVITFNSNRAGTIAARLRFTETCDIGDAVSTPSDHPDTERFEHIERIDPSFLATRTYRFDGGCVQWDFEFDQGAPSALSIQLGNSMHLMERSELQRILAESFLDEPL